MHVSRKAFDQLVEAAIASLPRRYARWLGEVAVIVEDRPDPADIRDDEASEDEPLGLYYGTSQLDHDGELPARVMLYRVPLMEACSSREELADEIRKTLLHELGHHAGLDEDDLDEHGVGPTADDDDIEFDVDDAT